MLRRRFLALALVVVIAGCGASGGRDPLPSPNSRSAPTSAVRTTGEASGSESPSDTLSATADVTPAPTAEPTLAEASNAERGRDKASDLVGGTAGNDAESAMGSVAATELSPTSSVLIDKAVVRPSPARVQAPSVGIDVPLDLLSLTSTRELEVPKDPDRAGWWRSGKGQSPIVVVGHVDSLTGPAVFFRVRDMKRGDDILLTLSDGTTRTFVVTSKEQFRKDSFPTDSVYRSGPGELRLVTCGGNFNRRSRHYVDNVIVFARPL